MCLTCVFPPLLLRLVIWSSFIRIHNTCVYYNVYVHSCVIWELGLVIFTCSSLTVSISLQRKCVCVCVLYYILFPMQFAELQSLRALLYPN